MLEDHGVATFEKKGSDQDFAFGNIKSFWGIYQFTIMPFTLYIFSFKFIPKNEND